jgi:hypothetical protein
MARINSPHGKWQSFCKLPTIKALRPFRIVDMGVDFGYRDFSSTAAKN